MAHTIDAETLPSQLPDVQHGQVWRTVVWDDPVNLQSYVAYVFETHFGFSHEHARDLMLRVHTNGHAVVAEGTRERMELHVEAMHGYGLWATLSEREAT